MTCAARLASAFLSGLSGAAILAACAAPPSDSYRDTSVFIGQTTRYDPGRMAGRWYVSAHFGPEAPDTLSYDAANETFELATRSYPTGTRGLVVMWVDTGFRTAAVGRMDGRTGFILDRTPTLVPDRYAAALDMMDFNGWDIGRITRVR